MIEITTQSPEQTHNLGRCLGRSVTQGLALRLQGDLGSGKTCFVQGLARGLDVPVGYAITSPTYTLINEYPEARLPLYHVDLYRLNDRVDAEMIGLWEIFDNNAVAAVEWAERLCDNDWPERNIKIEFRINNDESRSFRLIGSGLDSDYLIKQTVELFNANKIIGPI